MKNELLLSPSSSLRYSITPTLHFHVIDETDDYLVVDKPPFLLVHPTKPSGAPTLWKQLRELLAFEIANGGQVSIVNRLDRETSGLILVAKNANAARKFGLLMQAQRFHKEYSAIVFGWPDWEEKTIDAPIDRQGKHRESAIWLKQMIHEQGAPAQTAFQVARRFTRSTSATSPAASRLPLPGQGEDKGEGRIKDRRQNRVIAEKFAVVRAVPKTGRTHQIRVHLAALGHPIVGDKIYGPDERCYLDFIRDGWTENLAQRLLLLRHALHAARLQIENAYDWKSALPLDLAEFCSGGW